MTLAHIACQTRHSKGDFGRLLGDSAIIFENAFRRLFELPHKGGHNLGWDASPILGPSSSSTSTPIMTMFLMPSWNCCTT